MKKTFFAIVTALAVGFVSAVGLCIKALLVQPVAAFSKSEMRVVVDAGHGGIDGGVIGKGTGVKESELNLAIAMELKGVLEDMGFAVTLTRKTAGGLYGTTAKGFKKRDMQRRKEIIERASPALVISVHQNFYPSKATRGGQVFYSKKNEGSKKLAVSVQAKLNELYAKEKVKERKASAGEYFMLECAPCPSIIVECGFLSNEKDERLLQKAAWQRRLAESVVGGVLEYFAEFSA